MPAPRAPFLVALLLASALLVPGCAVGPDYRQPRPWSPSSWIGVGHHEARATLPRGARRVSVPVDATPAAQWWSQFHDPELTALESRVAHENLDVRLATIRLVESRAELREAAASRYPSLTGTAAYTREQFSSKEIERGLQESVGSGGIGSNSGSLLGSNSGSLLGSNSDALRGEAGSLKIPPLDLWQDGVDATWELDLWGRVRRSVEAARATLQASVEDRRSTLIAQFAEVARDYMTLRGQQTQLAVDRDNLKAARESLDLTQARFRGGLTSELDVENARSQLESVSAQIPDAERQIAMQINAIGLLLGAPPQALKRELQSAEPIPPVPPLVPVGVPSELARRRPDIREAEAQLHAATANVGVAVAAFYPRVTLSGALNFDSLSFRDLGFWSARAYTFGPSISLPIFQGGQLRGALQLNQARQQEAAVTYQRTVLQAWRDVDNALTAYAADQRMRDALERSVRSYGRALELARAQYASGLQTFLNVLDAERGLFNARGQLASSNTAISSDLVQLYNALGGGWETAFPQRRPIVEASSR